MSRIEKRALMNIIGCLDVVDSVEISNILKRLHAQGRTIILITHDLLIAQQAKQIVRFRNGRLNEVV
ncbi:hypothetical protein GC098_36860 [Paenibacillus sp. LMG 31458]|uniref:ABC transporter ATP-binding protein n=1 Tax=Paenibacillus phytorum TaxID=2654977 RepID=A0ABX1Y7G3_9BACL|nr:hypothetical protein [Paenibacillus phytorum]NOU76873.1 hypothetical protein [Paenibacillus phytorum]